MGGAGGSHRLPATEVAPRTHDDAIVRVILNGIPGPRMAGFWNLSEEEARQLTAYVRSLGRLPPETVPGDSAVAASCTTAAGTAPPATSWRGGNRMGTGPDDVGRRLNAAFLRRALIEPVRPAGHAAAERPRPYPAYLVLEVTPTREDADGTRVSEDDFTLSCGPPMGSFTRSRKPP